MLNNIILPPGRCSLGALELQKQRRQTTRRVLLQSIPSGSMLIAKEIDCNWIALVNSLLDHGKKLALHWPGCPAENGQSLMPRLQAAKMQQLHTFFIKQALNLS